MPWNRWCTQTHEALKVTNLRKPWKQGRRLGDGDRETERDTEFRAYHSFWTIVVNSCSDSSGSHIDAIHIGVLFVESLASIEGGWKQIRKVPRWASSHCTFSCSNALDWAMDLMQWVMCVPDLRHIVPKFRWRIWTSVLDILVDFFRRDLDRRLLWFSSIFEGASWFSRDPQSGGLT